MPKQTEKTKIDAAARLRRRLESGGLRGQALDDAMAAWDGKKVPRAGIYSVVEEDRENIAIPTTVAEAMDIDSTAPATWSVHTPRRGKDLGVTFLTVRIDRGD